MGKSAIDFSFKAILQSIHIGDQTSYKRNTGKDIVKNLKNGSGDGQENLAVADIFDSVFDKNYFGFEETIKAEYDQYPRVLYYIFTRKLDRGNIRGKEYLEAISDKINDNTTDTIQHITGNLIGFLRKCKAEKITKEHAVFKNLSPSKIGNKSSSELVEYIEACADEDPYEALAIVLLVSLYPIPEPNSKKPDLLENVITRCLLDTKCSKGANDLPTDSIDQLFRSDQDQKTDDNDDVTIIKVSQNKGLELLRALGIDFVKGPAVIVVPMFALVAVLSLIYIFSQSIENQPGLNESNTTTSVYLTTTNTTPDVLPHISESGTQYPMSGTDITTLTTAQEQTIVTQPSDNRGQTPVTQPSGNQGQTPVTQPSGNQVQHPVTQPSDAQGQTPVTQTPDNQRQSPVTQPSDNQGQTPVTQPSDDQGQTPVTETSDTQEQTPETQPPTGTFPDIEISSVNAHRGESDVCVSVTFKNLMYRGSYSSIDMNFNAVYNSALVFKQCTFSRDDSGITGLTSGNGQISFNMHGNYCENNVTVNLFFDIPNDVPDGDYEIRIFEEASAVTLSYPNNWLNPYRVLQSLDRTGIIRIS